jgi:hypothetical protein
MVTRFLLCGSVLMSALAFAQRPASPDDCDDAFAECKEDCTINFGGNTNDKARAKVNKCLNKCNTVDLECRERFFETKRNNLDEGALKDAPGSRQEDENGMPNRSASSSKKRDPGEGRTKVSESPPPPAKKADEDLRDDRREEKAEKKKADPPPEELKPEETPKSNRTAISKVDPKTEKKAEEPPTAKSDEPRRSAGRDTRDEDKPPPARKAEKREDAPSKTDEPKKKQKALDEWDPDAL